MTHFGLGSSGEDPWGKPIRGVVVGLPFREPALSAWEVVLFPWEAWGALCLTEHLALCLPDLVVMWLPDWLRERLLPAWEGFSPAGNLWWPHSLLGRKHCHWEGAHLPELFPLSCFLPLGKGEQLPASEAAKLLPSPEGRLWPAWDAPKLPSFPGGEGEHLPGNELLVSCLPGKLINCFLPQREGECLPERPEMPLNCFFLGGRWASAWEWTASELPAWEANKLLPSPEGRWVPAWEAWDATKLLPSWGGRWASAWEWTASELPAWEANKLLPSLREGECLLSEMPLNCFLPWGEVSTCLGMNC